MPFLPPRSARTPASFHLIWTAVAVVAMVVGAGWRLSQYLSLPSLMVDEIALARNVLDRTAPELFHRLEYGQVAPIGFLLAVKACTKVFGPSEWSLRLVPLVCGLSALPLFWYVAR